MDGKCSRGTCGADSPQPSQQSATYACQTITQKTAALENREHFRTVHSSTGGDVAADGGRDLAGNTWLQIAADLALPTVDFPTVEVDLLSGCKR